MTDNELLLSISNIMDTKLSSLENRMDKRFDALDKKIDNVEEKLNHSIDEVEENLNRRIDTMEVHINAVEENLNRRIDTMEVHINAVEESLNAKIHKTNHLIENQVLLRIKEIESCYLSTFERYQQEASKIEQLQLDGSIIKDVLIEHGEKIKTYQACVS